MTADDSELLNAVGGDRAQARILGQVLQHLARTSPDERLREMASGVINGDLSLTAAAGSSYYGEAIGHRTAAFTTWYDALSDTERAEHANAGATEITRVRGAMDCEAAAERHNHSS